MTKEQISKIAEAAIEACGLSPWDWSLLKKVEDAVKDAAE